MRIIVDRFRPVVGEEEHAGKWRATFYAAGREWADETLNMDKVLAILANAGISANALHREPTRFSDISDTKHSSPREDAIISNETMERLRQYVQTTLQSKPMSI